MTDPLSTRRRLGQGARRLLLGAAFAATFAAGGLTASGLTGPAFAMALEHAGMGAMASHGDLHAMMRGHIDHLLTAVDATADQKTRIHAIFKTAFERLGPLHEKVAGVHGDLHRILAAPTIDRAALEQLRAARLGDADEASKILVQAMADAAEVLTPEQRAKLATVMSEHPSHHS
jgi:Spy/CpxP family protein refolding chaperone